MHDEQHALFAVNAGVDQCVGKAARLGLELPVGQRSVIIDIGDLVGPSAIGFEQMVGKVEWLVEINDVGWLR